MRTKLVLAAVLAAMACAPAFAQDRPSASSGPSGNGRFRAHQVLTADRERLLADWAKPGPGASLQATSRTVRGREITSFLVIGGCTPAPTGRCDVVADFEVLDPSGGVSVAQKGLPVWSRAPAPGGAFVLSDTRVGIAFDGTDALGAYRVRSTVTDRVANVTVGTEDVLSLVAE